LSRFIKFSGNHKITDQLEPFNVVDVVKKLDAMHSKAEKKAKQIIQDAQEEATEIRGGAEDIGLKQGYDDGYALGLKEGREIGNKEGLAVLQEAIDPVLKTLNEALSGVEIERSELRQRTVSDLLDLSFQVAEVIVKSSITLDETVVERNVEQAIEMAMDKSRLEVIVNPDCLELIEQYLPELKDQFSEMKDFALVGDENVEVGGCIVKHPEGSIDANIDMQLSEMRKQLTQS